jgi:glycosyltransferase involved in cell wall biosynthesis
VSRDPKIVFVQDALPFLGGAERVLSAAWEIYPDAPLYTLLYSKGAFQNTPIAGKTVIPSFINRLPGARTRYPGYLPLMPLAVERFDLREFDIILSFSYAVAHGVLPRPDQLHISYTYTPMRYAWHFYHQYLHEAGLRSGLKGWLAQAFLHYLRLWDRSAADRVDRFVAISHWVAQGVWRSYRRPAEVIYPPVDTLRFSPQLPREDYYLTVSRLVSHKKIDLLVGAFSRLGLPLLVVGDGPEYRRLSKMAAPNVKMLGRRPDDEVVDLLGRARAFVQTAEEDFGIAIAEAQAAGCPVIAYGSGGGREIVIPEVTGLFFPEQTVESLIAAVEQFETGALNLQEDQMISHVERFSKARFQQELKSLIEDSLTRFEDGEESHW